MILNIAFGSLTLTLDICFCTYYFKLRFVFGKFIPDSDLAMAAADIDDFRAAFPPFLVVLRSRLALQF